jgi:hypothetical protein
VALSLTKNPVLRFWSAVGLSILGLVVAVAVWWLWVLWRYEKPFHRVARGDSEARVVLLLGKPHSISTPHDFAEQDWSGPDSFGITGHEIVKEFRYEVPFPLGDEYVIGFDADDHAVLKSRLISP